MNSWQQTVNHLFEDEDKLIEKLRRFQSIDAEAGFRFFEWVIRNWTLKGRLYVNKNTREQVAHQELKKRYKKEVGNG